MTARRSRRAASRAAHRAHRTGTRTPHDGERLARQRAAADRRLERPTTVTRRGAEARATASARASQVVGAAPRSSARPGSRARRGRRGTARGSPPPRRASTLSGRIARASGSLRSRAMRSARPTTKPGLRAADQLVAAERHEVGAGGQALRGHRLVREAEGRGVEQRAAAQVVDDDRPVRVGDRRQLARGSGTSTKPVMAEVRRVDAEDEPGAAVGERRLEVVDARPVRRADLDEPRARPSDDLGDPDAAPDLDELAARHGDAAPRPASPTASATRRGVVVRDERVLGAGQRDQVLLGRAVARGPRRPDRAVELEEERSPRPRAAASMAARGHGARPGWCGRSPRWH